MSFGFGVGDFLAAFELANKLRRRFVNAPAEFRLLSEDVKQLSSILRDIDDLDPDDELSGKQKARLGDISSACGDALLNLQNFLDKYQDVQGVDASASASTASRSRRVWKRLRWDATEGQAIQSQLQSSINAFNLFLSGLNVQINLSQKTALSKVQQTQDDAECEKMLRWLSALDFGMKHTDCVRRHQPGTSEWILSNSEFTDWVASSGRTLLAQGIPGVGKTITASVVIEHLVARFVGDERVVVVLFDSCDRAVRSPSALKGCMRSIANSEARDRQRQKY
ncbi:hypothetical protein BJX64DRAFT_281571 [Aspergillus heterothallicus]